MPKSTAQKVEGVAPFILQASSPEVRATFVDMLQTIANEKQKTLLNDLMWIIRYSRQLKEFNDTPDLEMLLGRGMAIAECPEAYVAPFEVVGHDENVETDEKPVGMYQDSGLGQLTKVSDKSLTAIVDNSKEVLNLRSELMALSEGGINPNRGINTVYEEVLVDFGEWLKTRQARDAKEQRAQEAKLAKAGEATAERVAKESWAQ